MTDIVADVRGFLEERGLHDVTIERATYDAENAEVVLEVADLNWNHEGSPGYQPRPCRLIFSSLQAFSIQAGQDRFHTSIIGEGVSIADAYAITKDAITRLDLVMSTSERWYVEFGQMAIEDRE